MKKSFFCTIVLSIGCNLFAAHHKPQESKQFRAIPWHIADSVERGNCDDEDIEQVKNFLNEDPDNIYATDLYGETLVEIASKNKKSQIILKLCQQRVTVRDQQKLLLGSRKK